MFEASFAMLFIVINILYVSDVILCLKKIIKRKGKMISISIFPLSYSNKHVKNLFLLDSSDSFFCGKHERRITKMQLYYWIYVRNICLPLPRTKINRSPHRNIYKIVGIDVIIFNLLNFLVILNLIVEFSRNYIYIKYDKLIFVDAKFHFIRYR